MGVLEVSDFKLSSTSAYLSRGITSYIDIAKLLLQLNHVSKSISSGISMDAFHTQERSLYEPLKLILEGHLPTKNIVNVENLLYKTSSPQSKTDISIREISHISKERKDKNLNCSHFIEIKSLFHNENISKQEIERDLEKLLDCEKSYHSKCFFVLVGLQKSIKNNIKSLEVLGTLGENQDPFKATINNGKTTLYIRPAGDFRSDDPYVFVFEVSSINKYNSTYKSGIEYSIFQKN